MPPEQHLAHAPVPDETDAMQIGRDDWQHYRFPSEPGTFAACPFPQGSEDAGQWSEGWRRERDGK